MNHLTNYQPTRRPTLNDCMPLVSAANAAIDQAAIDGSWIAASSACRRAAIQLAYSGDDEAGQVWHRQASKCFAKQ